MTLIALKCPHCHSELVGKHGIYNGKQRYICKNPDCPHTTFYTEYTYNACKPGVKEAVRKQAVNGSGVRAISRYLGVSTGTVIAELKKEADISNVNKEYFQSRSRGKIRIEMDEMWSYWHNKKHQIWLWWAIDHDTGVVVAFWFGTREHGNLDKLLELLKPLDIGGTVYTDGNYAYYERIDSDVLVVTKKNTQNIERKHLSLRTWCSRLVRKGIRFSKTEQMHKIVVGLIINVWFFGYHWLIQ